MVKVHYGYLSYHVSSTEVALSGDVTFHRLVKDYHEELLVMLSKSQVHTQVSAQIDPIKVEAMGIVNLLSIGSKKKGDLGAIVIKEIIDLSRVMGVLL
ncbi:hypothetical protein L1049_013218 [Liquidambar formosana]|uniref:Uncharacterized protein n=1 Tax=Liquidambar formosana TaxID=63359 RepID=A0AAP0RK95_LIQFO